MKQTLRVNNSRILIIKNAKPSGYYFYMNLNIWGDFQICISVPLSVLWYRCFDLAIYTDLLTLNININLFKQINIMILAMKTTI